MDCVQRAAVTSDQPECYGLAFCTTDVPPLTKSSLVADVRERKTWQPNAGLPVGSTMRFHVLVQILEKEAACVYADVHVNGKQVSRVAPSIMVHV